MRIGSPTDIVLLDEQRDLPGLEWKSSALSPDQRRRPASAMSPEEHRMFGNTYAAKGWWVAAERAYSEGLRVVESPADDLYCTLRLNRAYVRLKLQLWRSALADAQAVLVLDRSMALNTQPEEKALFRAASAEYNLQLWDAAGSHFEQLAALGSEEGKSGVQKVAARRKEAKTGAYNWSVLYDASLKGSAVDVADHVSDALVVAAGRQAIVASRDIEPGELLMGAKALCSSRWENVVDKDVMTLNLHSQRPESAAATQLTHQLAMRCVVDRSPSNLRTPLPTPRCPDPVLRPARRRPRLIDDPSLDALFGALTTGFGFPPLLDASLADLKPRADVKAGPVDIDITKLELVCTHRATVFSAACPLVPATLKTSSGDPPPLQHSLALFVLPSLLKHSCLPSRSVSSSRLPRSTAGTGP